MTSVKNGWMGVYSERCTRDGGSCCLLLIRNNIIESIYNDDEYRSYYMSNTLRIAEDAAALRQGNSLLLLL